MRWMTSTCLDVFQRVRPYLLSSLIDSLSGREHIDAERVVAPLFISDTICSSLEQTLLFSNVWQLLRNSLRSPALFRAHVKILKLSGVSDAQRQIGRRARDSAGTGQHL